MHKDLVEQETTTVGTGAYTVSGSVTGRQTFATAFATGDTFAYVATDDAGNFESAIGTWDETAGTVARTKVLNSSNAGAAVSWAAGTKRIYVATGAAMQPGVSARHNLTAADNSFPGNSNNASEGYAIGSTWQAYDTTKARRRLFMLDHFSGSNAIWNEAVFVQSQVGSAGGEIIVGQTRVQAGGYLKLHDANYDQGFVGMVAGVGAELDGAVNNLSDIFVTGGSTYTTGATPTKLALDGDISWDSINLYNGSVVGFEAIVTARKDNGDRKVWKVQCVASCASGTVTLDLNTATVLFASAGASSWSLTCVALGTYGVALEATGAASSKIVWSAVITGSFVNQA